MKAAQAGPVIGKALEAWDPASPQTTIAVFVNLSWYNPGAELAVGDNGNLNLSDLKITETGEGSYQVLKAGELITKIEALANLLAANIKAGTVEAGNLVTQSLAATSAKVDSLLVTAGLVSPSVKTQIISPVAESNLVVNLENSQPGSTTSYAKLIVQGEAGAEVSSIDSQGNATFAGEVNSQSLSVESDASVEGDLKAKRIYAEEIVSRAGSFSELFANKASGITREEVEALLAQAQEDQTIMNQASSWEIDSSNGSASLSSLTLENLYVTGSAAVDSLSVVKSIEPLLIGEIHLIHSDLIISIR